MKLKRCISLMLALLLGLTACAAVAEHYVEGPLKEGDTGAAVTRMQERLIELGYLQEEASGVYDAATKEAVLLFQEENQLLETGIADQVTLDILMSDQAMGYTMPELEWLAETESGAVEDRAYSMPAGVVYNTMSPTMSSAGTAWYSQEIPFNTDEYAMIHENGFVSTRSNPLSTFAADVDTSSYAQMRRRILNGEAVPADSVLDGCVSRAFADHHTLPEIQQPRRIAVHAA